MQPVCSLGNSFFSILRVVVLFFSVALLSSTSSSHCTSPNLSKCCVSFTSYMSEWILISLSVYQAARAWIFAQLTATGSATGSNEEFPFEFFLLSLRLPSHYMTRFGYALLCMHANRYAEAASHYRLLSHTFPRSPYIYAQVIRLHQCTSLKDDLKRQALPIPEISSMHACMHAVYTCVCMRARIEKYKDWDNGSHSTP